METVSDKRYDTRFDTDFASNLLLEIAQERSLEGLMEKAHGAAKAHPEFARVETWLIGKGDLCLRCPQRPRCPDQTRCLHLVVGSENTVHDDVGEATLFFNTEERIPLGVGFIGRIATTGQLTELRNLKDARGEFSVLGSLQLDGIQQCVGTAISYRGEILGVLAIFSRVNVTKDRLAWQQIFSNHFGAAIANARAFEEIRVAGKRIEEANQRLELELVKRKQTEEKLRESEQHYRRIVETASEGIWEVDEQFITTLVNRRMAEMLGYEPQEMVGRKLHEFLFEDDQAEMSARIAARRQGLTERYEQRYRRKDGSTVWTYVSATSVRNAEHRFLGSFAMLMDITERKRAFEEIQRLKSQLEMQNAYLQEEVVEAKAFGELVGKSRALHNIVKQIDLVAPTDASVLILGETGTGKELVAHEIHNRSTRKDGPLVRVNCASIPRDLFESELFGHMRGSFTGAVKDRAGRFETAEGGTIFLDEVGEIPLDIQSKLLRVLQEKCYERVGDDRTRRADVRIVAATNRDLKKEAVTGRFREDLFYRLNVFPIQVAPLRERHEDIPLLAQHFINLSVKEMGCAKPRLTRAGIVQLQGYDWTGNIRELRNVIERAVILARGGTLEFDLPAAETALVPARRATREASDTEQEFLTESELQRRERENLLIILEKANWKIKGADGAAELLGVNSATLLSRMKKMGLNRKAAK